MAGVKAAGWRPWLARSRAANEPAAPARPAPGARRFNEARFCIGAAIAALVLAAAIRIVLADYSPWFDEYASVFFSDQPVARLWSGWMVRETNPPLYYTLLAGWRALFGDGAAAMRLLSILGGVAGLAVLTDYCRRWYGPRAALAVALLGAVSAGHIFYSEQLRGYIFAFGAVAVALSGLTLLVAAPERRRVGGALYAAGSLVAIYCHTTMFLWPVAATAGALLTGLSLRAPIGRLVVTLAIANLAIALGSAWWLHMTVLQLAAPNKNISWLTAPTLSGYQYLITRTILLSREGLEGVSRIAVYAALLVSLAGVALSWRNPATRLVVTAGGLSIILFDAVSAIHPIAVDRTVFWMTVFPLVLMAAAIGSIRNVWAALGVGGGLLALLLANLAVAGPHFETEPWRATIAQVARDPNAVLVVEGSAMNVVAPAACRVAVNGPCPVPIVSVTSLKQADAWADGLPGPALVAPRALAGTLPAGAHVYTLKRSLYDPAATLGLPVRPGGGLFVLAGPFGVGELPSDRPSHGAL